ncbi:MAG: phospho-sugar mutase, partial [Oscillospiraceae bacterium]|nr:phospho-sugar mutase [Candidatus Equicaccousia limihippi]
IYTVGQATQGLADYLKTITDKPKVAIGYDCRHKSLEFAQTAASVLAANGVKVYLYPKLCSAPMLSFAVRYHKCNSGIMITASHNPSKYNGYKAYDYTGCQFGLDESEAIASCAAKCDLFNGINKADFQKCLKEGSIEYIGQETYEAYYKAVLNSSMSDSTYDFSSLSVIYTPLHGAGNEPVREILKRVGIKNVKVVETQEKPDGDFPTLKFPNPEFPEAFDSAKEIAEKSPADILLATDPDSDRVGVALLDKGEYRLINGNCMGVLLLKYLLTRKTETNTLPQNPVAVKTIVSTDLCYKVCADFNCELRDVLTGFKFIGGVVKELEDIGQENRYIMGFEESYGYLIGGYVRDKDAVVASMLICEMVCYYKQKGKNLFDVLEDIYKRHGYYFELQNSTYLEGEDGMLKMAKIMENLRKQPLADIGGIKVIKRDDYQLSEITDAITGEITEIKLPKSNVIAYHLQDGSRVT